MSKTSIEWTQETWNPVRGCSRISPGCVNCYAERMAARELPGLKSPTTGEPFAIMTPSGPHWTGKVELIPGMLDIPLRRKKPTTYFVNSMSDLFHEGLSDEAIDRVFAVMALCPQHTFQVLTKRAGRMREYFTRETSPYFYPCTRIEKLAWEIVDKLRIDMEGLPIDWPLPNVWLGVSVEDQQRKNRIDILRETPAAVRFVSFEPLLEDLGPLELSGIDLAIWGGESGPGARPCNVWWIRGGMQMARIHGCKNFVKQLGAHATERADKGLTFRYTGAGKAWGKGGDPSEWPADLRVREMPKVEG